MTRYSSNLAAAFAALFIAAALWAPIVTVPGATAVPILAQPLLA